MSERWLLEIADGGQPAAELPRAGVLVVGSSKERAGYVVLGAGVAEVHCAIGRTKGGGWAVKDLGSSGGTLVNGRKIDSVRLQPGDRIVVGARELRIVDADRPTATEVPRPAASAAATPASIDPMPTPVSGPAPASSEALGSTATRAAPLPSISGYRIERLLGRGGMGQVYLAVQTSLERQVALKVLSKKLEADQEFVRRFQAEARAAAALNHPNVVTVYDVGDERGTHYLSMEYMDRGNLEDRIAKDGKIAWREALGMLRDAASGLVYAEARGIVHRDLKPANLMQNHVGATKIADLGLATHVESEDAQSADKKVFGTPHFMSPEQARGERVDSRSDLYSLGATAYRMLTGHTPFEGANSREILRAHARDEPRPMSEFVPDLPESVVALVTRLMRKNAAERFNSAAQLLSEIDRIRAQSAPDVAAPAPAAGKRAALLVVGALALLAAGAWFVSNRGASPDATRPGTPPPAQHGSASTSTPAPPTPPGEPSTPDATSAAASASTPAAQPEDDDKALALFEANARVALLELSGRELDADQRGAALRALATEYKGTSAATEALDKADAIDADAARAQAQSSDFAARREAALARLRAAAALDRDPPQPGASLQRMRTIEDAQAFEGDPLFTAERKSIEQALLQAAVAHARKQLAAAQLTLESGKFDDALATLSTLAKLFELPDFPPGQGPSGLDEFFEAGRTVRERLALLEGSRGSYASKQVRDDELSVAAGFGGPRGLERELKTFDFEAASRRLTELARKLVTPPAQTFAAELRADLEHARGAFELLGREYAAGGWRRKGFNDPRDKKNVLRNAIRADAGGVYYEGEGGAPELVPWSAFADNTRELSKLFTERLNREYSADELRAIAGLTRLTAIVEAIEHADKMFDASRRSNFTEGDARELEECFTPAQSWAQRAGSSALLTRETAAARLLADVLQRATEQKWSVAVAGTERLLGDYRDTLFVKLLSDGVLPQPPPAERQPALEKPATPPEPAALPEPPKGKDQVRGG